ncbi:MAG TPA: gliding motility-associated C-terminal domain-containing protein, partial [Bacteroidia bacterium]
PADTMGYTYNWSPVVEGQNDTMAIVVQNPGTYNLTVTDSNGCVSTASFVLEQVTPTIQFNYFPLICREDTADIKISGSSTTPVSISFPNPANIITTNLIDSIRIHKNGVYPVLVTDQNGCTATSNISINYYPKPLANFYDIPDSVSELGIPVYFANSSTITGGTITGYEWSFGDGTYATGVGPQIHDYAVPGDYSIQLIVTSNKGCKDTVASNHLVEVHLPLVNIITPNEDAINNRLEFRNLQFFSENKISIFNRWGKKIYEKDNYDNSWNGDGHEAGTYYYILEVKGHRPESVLTSFFQIIK